jgi:hypothetical protein
MEDRDQGTSALHLALSATLMGKTPKGNGETFRAYFLKSATSGPMSRERREAMEIRQACQL